MQIEVINCIRKKYCTCVQTKDYRYIQNNNQIIQWNMGNIVVIVIYYLEIDKMSALNNP